MRELGTVAATSMHTYSLGNESLGTVAATSMHTCSLTRCMYSI